MTIGLMPMTGGPCRIRGRGRSLWASGARGELRSLDNALASYVTIDRSIGPCYRRAGAVLGQIGPAALRDVVAIVSRA